MNSQIASTTKVHVVGITADGRRQYLVDPAVRRNAKMEWELWPLWGDQPKDSRALTLEYALIFRDRMRREHGTVIHFTLRAGDDQFIEFREPGEVSDHTKRVPMTYRGLVATPGFDVRLQQPVWYVRFVGTSIESFRGATVEEVVDKVYERPDLLQYAEKAPPAPAPAAPVREEANTGPRMRPGDIDYRAPIRRGR